MQLLPDTWWSFWQRPMKLLISDTSLVGLSSPAECCCLLEASPRVERAYPHCWFCTLTRRYLGQWKGSYSLLWALSRATAGLCRYTCVPVLPSWLFALSLSQDSLCPWNIGSSSSPQLHREVQRAVLLVRHTVQFVQDIVFVSDPSKSQRQQDTHLCHSCTPCHKVVMTTLTRSAWILSKPVKIQQLLAAEQVSLQVRYATVSSVR